jgi:hypothetical protein
MIFAGFVRLSFHVDLRRKIDVEAPTAILVVPPVILLNIYQPPQGKRDHGLQLAVPSL